MSVTTLNRTTMRVGKAYAGLWSSVGWLEEVTAVEGSHVRVLIRVTTDRGGDVGGRSGDGSRLVLRTLGVHQRSGLSFGRNGQGGAAESEKVECGGGGDHVDLAVYREKSETNERDTFDKNIRKLHALYSAPSDLTGESANFSEDPS